MNRVDATSPVGEKAEPQQVPVKHPRWCDRSLCTVRDWAEVEEDSNAGSHFSANLAASADYVHGSRVPVRLRQTIYGDHEFNVVVLEIGETRLLLADSSPMLWALIDECDRMKKILSPSMKGRGRADAFKSLLDAQEARS